MEHALLSMPFFQSCYNFYLFSPIMLLIKAHVRTVVSFFGVGGGGYPKARQTVKEGNNDLLRLSSITGWGVALGGAEGIYSAISTC